jgi:hypothetical protein
MCSFSSLCLYRVSAASTPKDSTLSLPRYRLEGIPQRFYANELQKVDVTELVSITEEDTSESDDSEIEIATALQRRKVRSPRDIRRPSRLIEEI